MTRTGNRLGWMSDEQRRDSDDPRGRRLPGYQAHPKFETLIASETDTTTKRCIAGLRRAGSPSDRRSGANSPPHGLGRAGEDARYSDVRCSVHRGERASCARVENIPLHASYESNQGVGGAATGSADGRREHLSYEPRRCQGAQQARCSTEWAVAACRTSPIDRYAWPKLARSG